jgi:hypothetical protein
MNHRNFGAYSRHSAEELDAQRAPAREAMLRQHAIERTASQRAEIFTRLQNIATCCDELGEVAFALNSNDPASREADLRSTLGRLRYVEAELDAAVGRLAGELGLVAVS